MSKVQLTPEELKEAAREKYNEYQREYRKKNQEKICEQQFRYWERKVLKRMEEEK